VQTVKGEGRIVFEQNRCVDKASGASHPAGVTPKPIEANQSVGPLG
jgi:hypothetical protein